MSRLHDGLGAEARGTRHRFLGVDDVGATAPDCMALGRESSDVEETSAGVDVEEAKKTTKKKKPMVRPDPLGSFLSTAESLDALRARCRIPEEIVFVVPTLYAKQDNDDWDANVTQLRSRLSSAYTRVVEAVGAAREDMTRGIEGRVSRAVELLAKFGREAKEDMLDLAEIDANQGSSREESAKA
ncbi:hypothetical protein AALP_AA6G222800 [Arabis alpina]|uniref:Uncharacterized protein n=1 Tax=Arabis alpina TaxID=50452 RepID=A0A087GQY4_ARAAL|nr:hypothetical protein AALP_AA6G222800 [Arabis alpina]